MKTIDFDREMDQRYMRWGDWRNRQDDVPTLSCQMLGELLGEAMEGYRRFGIRALAKDKPFANLIHGKGTKPDRQEDDAEEWEIQHALDNMPDYMMEIRKVLETEYRTHGAQASKAKSIRLKAEVYERHWVNGLSWTRDHLIRLRKVS